MKKCLYKTVFHGDISEFYYLGEKKKPCNGRSAKTIAHTKRQSRRALRRCLKNFGADD